MNEVNRPEAGRDPAALGGRTLYYALLAMSTRCEPRLRAARHVYALRASAWLRPESDLCKSLVMSLGEMMPASRPLSMTRVRPSLHPLETPSRSATGSAGLAVDTLSSGQATSLIRVVARAFGATCFRAAKVKIPLRRPLASWVGKVECREVRM
jgi:hypothetical protein